VRRRKRHGRAVAEHAVAPEVEGQHREERLLVVDPAGEVLLQQGGHGAGIEQAAGPNALGRETRRIGSRRPCSSQRENGT